MPSPFATTTATAADMETNSQYSSCETLDSHRSSECDEKNEVNGNSHNKSRKISAEHTDYIVKERVTRKEPPKPAYNPMQFVAMKPSNLHCTAQEQLKKAEEIKKVQKESSTRKEEPEDWQNNLDNWKSSRRKRVEHIIDRVVEVKKLEEEEHDRNRRSIKTFSELMEERGSRRKLSTLAIYTEEDTTIDMSDLTPTATEAKSIAAAKKEEDEKNLSDKMKTNSDNNSDKKKQASDTTDDVFNNNKNNNNDNNDHKNNNNNNSSKSNSNFHSTALIKDVIHRKQEEEATSGGKKEKKRHEDDFVKTEIEQRITTDLSGSGDYEDAYKMTMSAKVTTTTSMSATKTSIRSLDARERDYTYDDAIEDYKTRVSQAAKLDLPKIDINKKRELFEQQQQQASSSARLADDENSNISSVAAKLGTEIVSIKERISSLRNNLVTNGNMTTQSVTTVAAATPPPKKVVDLEVSTTIKDRLSSLHQQVSSPADEASKRILDTPFKNVHEARNEFELKQQQHLQPQTSVSRVSSEGASGAFIKHEKEANDMTSNYNHSDIIEHYQPNHKHLNTPPDVIQHESIVAKMTRDVEDDINEEDSSDCIEEALDMAFQLIDNENVDTMPNAGRQLTTMTCGNVVGEFSVNKSIKQPIYENVAEDDDVVVVAESVSENVNNEEENCDGGGNRMKKIVHKIDLEPHYQVPRSREPYYETPKKSLPIPLYENVELMFPASSDSSRFSMAESNESFGIDDGTEMVFPISTLVPPKEKPPPLPEIMDEASQSDNFKRINSTKRIKKEIRNKRSSFLGIDGQEFDDNLVELTVPPPPNMQAFLQEEKRYERQLYQKAGFYENAVNGESRDSGLDNHSRQSSEPSSASSSEGHTEIDGSGMLLSEQRGNFTSYNVNEDDNRIKTLEEQISQQENYSNYRHHQHDDSFDDDHQEVLRVEQLLLQIEQQELKRQRNKLIMHKNIARRELDEGVKMLMTTNNNNGMTSTSLQDLNVSNSSNETTPMINGVESVQYENSVSYRHHNNNNNNNRPLHSHNHMNEYRKSMPNLQEFSHTGAAWNQGGLADYQQHHFGNNDIPTKSPYQFDEMAASSRSEMHLHAPTPYQPPVPSASTSHIHRNSNNNGNIENIYGNMTRNALMQISAVPKPKLTNDWIQYRKSEPVKPSLNSHWLIQEAEQRRIEQMNNARSSSSQQQQNLKKKPLPDAIIQTIQQRIVDLGIGSNVNKRYTVFDSKQMPQIAQTHAPLLMMSQQQQQSSSNNGGIMHNPLSIQQQHPLMPPQQQLEILSVSSKKLCSYCSHELGSGAAMIIENLGLFYHIDCFKCSVCHTPIADGNIHGTDVRVRNSRLHCANCFSNEEGIKFSCV